MCSWFAEWRGALHLGDGNADQYQCVRESGFLCALAFVTFLEVSSSAPLERCLCSYGLQGGGLIIYSTATLTNANVYANKASKVCSPSVRSWHFHPVSRWNVACARRWQWGGGLSIHLGTATLTDTKVYANQAGYVSSPFERSLNFHPVPAGALRVLTLGSMAGGSTSRARQR